MVNLDNNNERKKGIGYVLKLLRIAREMSAKELANKMGVSASYITEIETNNKKPSLDMINKYSEALEVKKNTIFYFDDQGSENGYNYKHLLVEMLQLMIDNE